MIIIFLYTKSLRGRLLERKEIRVFRLILDFPREKENKKHSHNTGAKPLC
ncbi:hypothetical protein Chls_080 [Chlamydia suis]|uniref:Uncharacterized protein n=1 Tax=Chlamydia suis TaxID=83559 RepID=A0ABX6IRN2_9CHLA|nr:hypothetical protein Chls_080 [Chlamydia suis]